MSWTGPPSIVARWRLRCAGTAVPVLFCALLGLLPAAVAAQRGMHRVVPVLYLPADETFDARRLDLQVTAVRDAQEWYAQRTGGYTFYSEPLIIQRSRHTFAELAGNDFQNWWPLPEKEFADYGLPWNDSSTVKLLLLAQGGGAWAGADSENGGIERPVEAGGVARGALGGLAVVGDSSIGGILAGACPLDGTSSFRKPEGGTEWWCNWNTYRGTIAHELGHTFGLPHPDAFREGFRCDSTVITNMQCHWAWPADSLLPFEAAHLRTLPVFSTSALDAWTFARPDDGTTPPPLPGPDDPASVLWLAGRGGGTAYVHGYRIGPRNGVDTTLQWTPPPDVRYFAADLGLPPDATTRLGYSFQCGVEALTGSVTPGDPPRSLRLSLPDGCRLRLTVSGSGAQLGIGNPRWLRQ